MLERTNQAYERDAISISTCKEDDSDISQCTSSCSTYQIGGTCGVFGAQNCNTGNIHSISITCRGGLLPKEKTCEGEK